MLRNLRILAMRLRDVASLILIPHKEFYEKEIINENGGHCRILKSSICFFQMYVLVPSGCFMCECVLMPPCFSAV